MLTDLTENMEMHCFHSATIIHIIIIWDSVRYGAVLLRPSCAGAMHVRPPLYNNVTWISVAVITRHYQSVFRSTQKNKHIMLLLLYKGTALLPWCKGMWSFSLKTHKHSLKFQPMVNKSHLKSKTMNYKLTPLTFPVESKPDISYFCVT